MSPASRSNSLILAFTPWTSRSFRDFGERNCRSVCLTATEVRYAALRDSILTHPTLVEGLIPLFSSSSSIREPTGKVNRSGLQRKTVPR
jgi:hypothetical protein